MAVNKNALIRYKTLDRCFRNIGRRYDVRDLIEECSKVLLEISPDSGGVSRRTILQDIAFMESSEGWEIDLERTVDSKRVYFRYRDPSFSINNMPLNDVEISQLKSAIDTLSQFKGMPQFEWMNELIPKLRQGAEVSNRRSSIIQFDHNQDLRGKEYVGTLYNAISQNRVLSVHYQPFGEDEPYVVTFHPYCLKQYNNRWFVFGLDENIGKADTNLALDRIQAIREIGKRNRKSEIDWDEYFDDLIGVSKPEEAEAENLTLLFTPASGKYVTSKPLHGSQKTKWLPDGKLEVRLNLILNYELESTILSFGENVEVVKPVMLRRKIGNRIKVAMNNYK